MEHIKEAFSKVKQDIDILKKEVTSLNDELKETRQRLIEICDVLKAMTKKNEETSKKEVIKENISNQKEAVPNLLPYTCPFTSSIPPCFVPISINSTQNKETPTDIPNFTTHPAHKIPYNALKDENMALSTGNKGVPTDKQTNQQTDQQTDKSSYNTEYSFKEELSENYIDDAAKILDSLDTIKKEVRLKFKRLTDQEFSVFSAIYQLSEEEGYTDYKNLSIKLRLTESSIRDYIGRLIKKGIPVEKTKINNKTIHLSISSNLKKIASLPTILQLRAL